MQGFQSADSIHAINLLTFVFYQLSTQAKPKERTNNVNPAISAK